MVGPASVSTYRQWRLALVDEVVATSARPDEAFAWITGRRLLLVHAIGQHCKLTEAGGAVFKM